VTTLIVLSGANGFLGSRIKFALNQERSNYYCLGRVSTATALEEIRNINFFIKQKKIFKKITLIHLAGITEHSKIHLNEEQFVKDSIDICNGILQIKSSLELPITTVLPSSGKVYGSSSYSISEESKLNPKNILGETKLVIESVFRENQLKNESLIRDINISLISLLLIYPVHFITESLFIKLYDKLVDCKILITFLKSPLEIFIIVSIPSSIVFIQAFCIFSAILVCPIWLSIIIAP
jgi:hypothetical protein